MLDKQTRHLLNYLIDKSNKYNGQIWLDDVYDEYPGIAHLTEHQVMAAMRYLVDNHYAQFGSTESGSTVGIEVEHMGYRHKTFFALGILRFIEYSIATPIAVALVTSLLTSYFFR